MMVCHACFMQGKETILNKTVHFSLLVSLSPGLAASFYRENNVIFLLCMGKSELMYFDLNTFEHLSRGQGISLPFYNPFRLLINLILLCFVFLAPILYYRIFKFRLKIDSKAPGRTFIGTSVYWQQCSEPLFSPFLLSIFSVTAFSHRTAAHIQKLI